MTNANLTICNGTAVRCLNGSIDKNTGKGLVGCVSGFARLSAYHPREAYVFFEDAPSKSGWFWESDLEKSARGES